MANRELAEYAADQLRALEGIRYIPMMGGYIFYINDKIFGGIYGDGFIKSFSFRARSRCFMSAYCCSDMSGVSVINLNPNNSSIFCQSVKLRFELSMMAKASAEFRLLFTASKIF